MKTRFKAWHFAALAFIVAGICAAPLKAQQAKADLFQDGEDRAQLLVVRITAPTTEGAGILFHFDSKYAYGITARHVLFQQGRKVEGLQAHFQAWPHKQFPVEAHRLHHEEDLAVFRADLSDLNLSVSEILRFIPLDQLGSSLDLDPGNPLHSMGHSTVGGWISPKKEIQFAKADEGNKNAFLFELPCPQGHSGGAVFDGNWQLVGMMIEEELPYCRALRIEPILKIVQAWKLDISLRLPPKRQTDKASAKQITVAVMDFDNRSGQDLENLGFVAQDITTSSLHDLPGVALLTRDRLDSVRKELNLPDSVQTGTGISHLGRLLKADAIVTGSILRYDVERRTFEGYGTSALQDVFRMSISLQILHVDTGKVQFSKNFDIERTQQYPVASSAPSQPINRKSELLGLLLDQAKGEMRNALGQVAAGGGDATKFIAVRVTTSPAGADVILNGTYLGHTPYTLQVTADSHELQLELAGHESWRRRVKIEPGMAIEVNLVPK
ncbi:MAG TPA: PEGA domain-containing protein [Thermoanaerobaculia bacterium]|nr:PEGA domain-containing protein [Thermoanaerobaculia bacterium]